MPRTKAPTPASTPSLEGVVVAFASYSPGFHRDFANKTVTQLKSDIARCGGSYSTRIHLCTHLIATSAQFDRQIKGVKEALQNPEVKILTYDWLAASLVANCPVDIGAHILGNPTANDVDAVSDTDPQPAKKSAKRQRSGADDDELSLTTLKKAKYSPNSTDKSQKKVPLPTSVKKVIAPVDERIPDAGSYQVYVDDDGAVFDVTLNKSNSDANNNKFYRAQLLISSSGYRTWTRWGRVGEKGQSKMLGDGSLENALKEFKKKFKEKHGNTWEDRDGPQKPNKYTLIEINYEDSDDENKKASTPSTALDASPEKPKLHVKCTLEPPVQRLMELIFNLQVFSNTMAALNYDADKMPLGKLSKKTLLKGYEVLKELASLIADPSLATGTGVPYGQAISSRSNQYFSLVPHVVGRKALPVLKDMDAIKREIQLLETLTDMQLANEIMKSASISKYKEEGHILDRQYKGLGMQEMTPLDHKSQEFGEISQYLNGSNGSTHGITYEVEDIFRIERSGEDDRLNKSAFANLGEKSVRRLLWHGSRCSNFGGILSQGLRIAPPEAPVSGYMFGKGVYLADMSSKSANYCASFTSGGTALLLLCEAELGKPPLKLTDSDYEAGTRAKENGSISTWGVGQTAPRVWKDASCINKNLKGVMMPDVIRGPPAATNEANAYLLYNEYIVYDVAQIKLRYLLRVKM